jgi:hypothetical protein
MSSRIHYQFELKDCDSYIAAHYVEELRHRAMTLPFDDVGNVQVLEGDQCKLSPDKPDVLHFMASLDSRCQGLPLVSPDHIIAFRVMPGHGCEAAWFGLRRCDGRFTWEAFCKTRALVDDARLLLQCHVSVIKVLDHAKQLGLLSSVKDDSGYWECRNWQSLVCKWGGHPELRQAEKNAIARDLTRWFGPLEAHASVIRRRREQMAVS